jgi:hypothetical protein
MNQPAVKAKETPKVKQRLGEILVKSGLINQIQLQQVLKRQTQVGGQLGSILIDMGFITINDLLNFLSKKFGVPAVNLFEMDIQQNVLNLLSQDKMRSLKLIPISADAATVTLAMLNPQDFITISEMEFMLGKNIKTAVVPSFMMDAALKCLPTRPGQSLLGEAVEKMAKAESVKIGEIPDLLPLLQSLSSSGASDILFTAGVPPSIRVDNKLQRLAMPALTTSDCEKYARELIPYNDWDEFIRPFQGQRLQAEKFHIHCHAPARG